MYPYQPLSGRDAQARREQLWNTVLDYRYGAGLKLAADDLQERARAEVARSRLLNEAGINEGASAQLHAVRKWMGVVLVRLGERVQGATVAGSPVPSAGTSS